MKKYWYQKAPIHSCFLCFYLPAWHDIIPIGIIIFELQYLSNHWSENFVIGLFRFIFLREKFWGITRLSSIKDALAAQDRTNFPKFRPCCMFSTQRTLLFICSNKFNDNPKTLRYLFALVRAPSMVHIIYLYVYSPGWQLVTQLQSSKQLAKELTAVAATIKFSNCYIYEIDRISPC